MAVTKQYNRTHKHHNPPTQTFNYQLLMLSTAKVLDFVTETRELNVLLQQQHKQVFLSSPITSLPYTASRHKILHTIIYEIGFNMLGIAGGLIKK